MCKAAWKNTWKIKLHNSNVCYDKYKQYKKVDSCWYFKNKLTVRSGFLRTLLIINSEAFMTEIIQNIKLKFAVHLNIHSSRVHRRYFVTRLWQATQKKSSPVIPSSVYRKLSERKPINPTFFSWAAISWLILLVKCCSVIPARPALIAHQSKIYWMLPTRTKKGNKRFADKRKATREGCWPKGSPCWQTWFYAFSRFVKSFYVS